MDEFLDISRIDSRPEQLKRKVFRILVPILCVVILMAAIWGIALFNYTSNRRDALTLSENLLKSLDRRIATEVRTFLEPASDMVKILDSTLKGPSYWEKRRVLGESLAIQMLTNIPQLSIFSFGDTQGNYLMLKKMPDKSIHTKLIARDTSSTKVTWIRRGIDGQELGRETTEGDAFDPRTRPWFIGALNTAEVYWTDVYIFFTDKIPGITASKAFRDSAGELIGVVGVDIELESLSQFLGALQIGRNGKAMIIDEFGRLVAFPVTGRMMKQKNGTLVPVKLNELNDPVLDRAFNRFRIEKEGYRELVVEGKKYINTVSSLQSTVGKNWSILLIVPADDFVGFVSHNYRRALLMSIGVLALASMLAGLLIWQGLRADRNASLLLSRRREMEIQSQAFSDLAANPSIFDPADIEALEAVTRIAAEAVGVRRVSVWRWQQGGRQLVCEDCYDRESDGHTRGAVLLQEDLPQLFEALLEEDSFSVADATHQPYTAELHRVYLNPLGCDGLLTAPIADEEKRRGALWFEQEGSTYQWQPEEHSFAKAVAGLLALRLSGDQRQAPCVPSVDAVVSVQSMRPKDATAEGGMFKAGVATTANTPSEKTDPGMRLTTIMDLRRHAFSEALKQQTTSPETIGADVFEDVSVLVLQFTDPIALAERVDGEMTTTAVEHLINRIEALASNCGIEYVKFMSDQLVCAAGFPHGDTIDHTHAVAELSLKIQATCMQLFEKSSPTLDFQIGIDTGAVVGSAVGREHQTYNLWGEAVRTAELMAESGSKGDIHVSESTYRRLPPGYHFKVRGRYYLPTVGELYTYILTGHL
jgi:class 3 adenylate cyclase